jgi:hypothetical protein
MTWALEQQAVTDASGRHVLLCLANYADKDGRAAFPSAVTLSHDTGLSERTVRSKLDLLESQGAIVKGNQAIAAAYIERADRRPVCYDLVLPLTDKPGAATAPRDDERGAILAATGCNPCSNGVQSTHERGAAIAGNPSFKPSFNPSVNPKDYADPSGTADLFAEPPADSASRADKKAKAEAFNAVAYLATAGVDDQVISDWIAHRKKKGATVTKTVIEELVEQAAKAGISLEKAMRECCLRGWQGFKAEWYLRDKQSAATPQRGGYQTKQDRIEAENAANRAEREARLGRRQPAADVTPMPSFPMLPNNSVQDVEFFDAR